MCSRHSLCVTCASHLPGESGKCFKTPECTSKCFFLCIKLCPDQPHYLISREIPRWNCWGAAQQLLGTHQCLERGNKLTVWDFGIHCWPWLNALSLLRTDPWSLWVWQNNPKAERVFPSSPAMCSWCQSAAGHSSTAGKAPAEVLLSIIPYALGSCTFFPHCFLMTSKLSGNFPAHRVEKLPMKALMGKMWQSISQIHANPQSHELLTLTEGNITTPRNTSPRDLTASAGLSN